MIDYATRNWLKLILRIRGTVVQRVAVRTLLCGAIAGLVVYLKHAQNIDLSTPIVVHSITGVALGLLLVFRTNASYDRYWEGRLAIGNIVAHSRDLARQTAAYFTGDPERCQLAGMHIIAFFDAIRLQLRHEELHSELASLIGEERAVALSAAEQPPLAVATWLTEIYATASEEGLMTEQRLRNLDNNLTALICCWTDAERIHQTPVPFAYAHHIKVFLTLFCFTLPFALAEVTSWYAVVGAAVVAFGMFGIDEIGVEIEDPFGYDDNDLPLDQIGRQLKRDIGSLTQFSTS